MTLVLPGTVNLTSHVLYMLSPLSPYLNILDLSTKFLLLMLFLVEIVYYYHRRNTSLSSFSEPVFRMPSRYEHHSLYPWFSPLHRVRYFPTPLNIFRLLVLYSMLLSSDSTCPSLLIRPIIPCTNLLTLTGCPLNIYFRYLRGTHNYGLYLLRESLL